ncbi:MAG: Uma2 family endonuclease [Gemmataceae bacterium]
MSRTLTLDAPALLNGVEPRTRTWSKEEFYRLADLGYFRGQRAELIEGEIMVMSPQKPEHYSTTEQAAEVLRDAFGRRFHVRVQGPIDLGPHAEPEPDVAVVAGRREDYRKKHPKTAALVVEVSDTTLVYDQTRKASLYARARLLDYWIINLVERQLEVYREPRADETQPYGFGYAAATVFQLDERVAPLVKPKALIRVADLFLA